MKTQTQVRSSKPPENRVPPSTRRIFFIDNLRWSLIILVISMHAADTYSPLGNWYFTDRRPLSRLSLLFFAAWQMYLQAFFMGLLFFIAGYFVPRSFDRKGPSAFLRERAFRLGLPVLFFMFCLGPVLEYYVAHSWTSTRPTTFGREWWKHIINGQVLQENGPLWFCLALLIFSVAYAAYRVLTPSFQDRDRAVAPSAPQLISLAVLMAVATFGVRSARPGSFLNMHLGDFPQYILLFCCGVASAGRVWLSQLSLLTGLRWLTVTLGIGFPAWLIILTTDGAFGGDRSVFSGGWHWQSAAIALWESFTCVGLSYGLLAVFGTYFNKQGKVSSFLSDNAFSVYVFHPLVVITAARLLTPVSWPSVVLFLVLTIVGTVFSFALSGAFFRRIPLLRSIL